MKKFAYVIAAIAAAFAVSCTKETPLETPNTDAPAEVGMKEVTITASIDPETKTSYDAEGVFSWTKGDQISVLCSDEAVHTFTATSSGASTTFTGLLPDGVTLGDQAFFPANENHAINSFYLAANSDALDASLPMVGTKTEGNSYEFAHCSGGFQFTIRNIPSEYTILGAEFVTSSLKISGTYEVWHDDNGKYIYGVYGAADDSEKKYSCKVTVSDGEAKVYLPYGISGDLWGTTTVKFVGYNETESKDLFSKDIKLGGKAHVRAVVIPVAPLVLNNLNAVNWENALTSTVDPTSEFTRLKEMKVAVDDYYMYVRLNGVFTNDYSGDYLDLFLSDGAGETTVWHGWTTKGTNNYNCGLSSHIGKVDKTTGKLTRMYLKLDEDSTANVDFDSTVSGTDALWYIAYPREHIERYAANGKVYVSFMLWNSWTPYGVIPTKGTSMLEVTLP